MSIKRFGLIGCQLSHSFSANYFSAKFLRENLSNHIYQNFPIDTIYQFPNILKQFCDIKGLNVTIPYKTSIVKYLDKLDPIAEKIGAVNTIQFQNNQLTGYNTDCHGFKKSFAPLLKPHHKKALVLGTGGASLAVNYVLNELNIQFVQVSRNPNVNQISYTQIDAALLSQYKIIINTTPVGMFPKIAECPQIDYNLIDDKFLLYDLVYNPEETLFLTKGKIHKATIKNGLEMLYLQAEKAWEIWNEV